jgi:DNA-binding beta-propeller fold protein YncE
MNYSSTSTFAAGTFTYDSSDITGVSRFSLESLSPVLSSENAFSYVPVSSSTCALGVLTQKSSDFTDMPLGKYPSWTFGDSLAVSIEGGTNPIMTVAVPQSALSNESSFWANKNKNVYTGLMSHFTKRGEQEQKNIYLTPSDSTGRVFSLSEASGTGALNDTSLRASLGSINCSTLNSPSPGFCSGTLAFTGSPGTGNAVCLFSFDNTDKDLLFCAAQSPSDNSRLITFLAGTSAVTKLEVAASPLHLNANQSSGTVNITVTNLTSRPARTINPDSLTGGERLLAPFTPLTNESLTGTFNPGGFITGNTCATFLPPYSTCTIQITYAPSAQQVDKQVFRLPYDKKQSVFQNASTQILASRGLSSLTLVAPDFTVGSAASAQVIATYANEQTQDVTALVNCNTNIGCVNTVEGYSTSNNQAVLVSNSGTLNSSQAGSATITARLGNLTAIKTVTAYAAAPNPASLTATAVSFSQVDLSWVSGGGSTNAFQIAYQAGATAPATCSAGTVIAATTQGLATTKSVTGLTASTQYSFRVCATNGAGALTSGVTASATTPAGVVACSGDCYADSVATASALAQGPGGVTMEYVFANGSSGFKIWKEKDGSRILNATGLVANGWQKRIERAGTSFTSTNFTVSSNIAGRVCPPNVFLSHSNMTATARCLYYDGGNDAQRLDKDSGMIGENQLLGWDNATSSQGSSSSYYEGNIQTCADKGMRLPTAYETTMTKPTGYLPIGDEIEGWDVSVAVYSNRPLSVASLETSPTGIFFKPDGTKMYAIGYNSDAVIEYSLSNPWNVATSSYVQVFSVAAQELTPQGLFFKPDGTKMYVIGNTGRDVNEYNLGTAWNISTASYVQVFSVAAQETAPTGIFFNPDGTKMYVMGSSGDDVNEYNLGTAWNISSASYVQVFSVAAQETTPQDVFFKPDGTKMYVMGSSGDDVNEYNLGTAWNVSTASYVQVFSVAAQETAPTGIFFKSDGTKMYVVGDTGDDVNEYTLSDPWNVSTSRQTQSVAAQEATPQGLFFKPDGTKMYVMGNTGDDVNEYTLSDPWNVSSASYVQVFSVVAQDTSPLGIFFKPDGTKMYVTGDTGNDVNEYTLSDPWNVSTASYVRVFSVATQETTPTGIFFKSDGTKMYVTGHVSDAVNEYNLSDPWNISTASYLQNFSVSSQEGLPHDIFFKPDGTKMYVVGDASDSVHEYTLGTAWNVSSASYSQVFSVASQETLPTSIFFKPDGGTKMYVTGHGGKSVYQYDFQPSQGRTIPLWAGSNLGVPSYSSWTWTASAHTSNTSDYWEWSSESFTHDNYSTQRSVRCVLPDNAPYAPDAPI